MLATTRPQGTYGNAGREAPGRFIVETLLSMLLCIACPSPWLFPTLDPRAVLRISWFVREPILTESPAYPKKITEVKSYV